MLWSALARTGELARINGAAVNSRVAPAADVAAPYAPVYAAVDGIELLLYRGHDDDSVRVLASTGFLATLAPGSVDDKWAKGCDGKWPLGIAVVGPLKFRATWLKPGTRDGAFAPRKRRGVADIDFSGEVPTITFHGDALVREDSPLVLLDFDGERCRFEVEGDDPTTDIQGATLGYTQRVNGRIVGHDAAPGAPNRIILADHDGLFLVCESDAAVRFPARLDVHGNVACFEGQYFTNADIRTRPLKPTTDEPIIVVTPESDPRDVAIASLKHELELDMAHILSLRADVDRARRERDTLQLDNEKLLAKAADLKFELEATKMLLPTERVFTAAELLRLVNNATGKLPSWWRYAGVQGAVDKAVKAELARR